MSVLILTADLDERHGVHGAEEALKAGQDTGGQTVLPPECSMGCGHPRYRVPTGKSTLSDCKKHEMRG